MQSHTYSTGNVAELAARLKVSARPGSAHDRLADALAQVAVGTPTIPYVAPTDPDLQQPGPAAYELRLSESQLHYLLVALAQCRQQGYYGADHVGRQEIDGLHDMLAPENLEPLPTCNDLTA
jgi:hypothetical protein